MDELASRTRVVQALPAVAVACHPAQSTTATTKACPPRCSSPCVHCAAVLPPRARCRYDSSFLSLSPATRQPMRQRHRPVCSSSTAIIRRGQGEGGKNIEPCRSCHTSAQRRSNMRSGHCGHERCQCASDDSIRCDSRRSARACGADRHPDDMCGAWPPWLLLWLFAVAVMTGGSCCCEGAAGRTEFCSDVGGVEAR